MIGKYIITINLLSLHCNNIYGQFYITPILHDVILTYEHT